MYEEILFNIKLILTNNKSDSIDKLFEYMINQKLYFFTENERKYLRYEIIDLLIDRLKLNLYNKKLFLLTKNLFSDITSFIKHFSDNEKADLLHNYKNILSSEEIKIIILNIKDKSLLESTINKIINPSRVEKTESFNKDYKDIQINKEINKRKEFNNYKIDYKKNDDLYITKENIIDIYYKKDKVITPEIEKNTLTIFEYLYNGAQNIDDLVAEYTNKLSSENLLALCFSNISENLILKILEKINDLDINYIVSIFDSKDFNSLIEKSDNITQKIVEMIGVKKVLELYSGTKSDTLKIIIESYREATTERFFECLVNIKDIDFIKKKLHEMAISQDNIIDTINHNIESEEFLLAVLDIYGVDIFKNYTGKLNIGIQNSIISNIGEDFFDSLSRKKQSDLFAAYRLVDNKKLFYKLIDEEKYNKFYKITGIDILLFLKYSNEFYLLNNIIDIIDNHSEQFEALYLKLKQYIKEDKLYGIPLLVDIVNFYIKYPKLVYEINLSNNLSIKEIKNIYRLLKIKELFDINNIQELNSLDDIIDDEINNAINNPDVSLEELKNIFLKNFVNKSFQEFGNILSYGINSKTLAKILSKKELMSEEEYFVVNSLDIFITFLTEIYALENKEKLKEALKLINTSEKRANYSNVFNYFSDINEKIREVYEIDANISLTNLSELPKGLFNEEYGYYDLSNSEYGLYTHSTELKYLKDLVEPRFSGYSYICLSGISDRMRKGNYHGDVIILYDHIPKGSFIASSPFNLSSSSMVRSNSYDMSEVPYVQMEFKDNTYYRMGDKSSHSETNVYREDLLPAGVLVQKDVPSKEELEAQKILSQLLGKDIPLIKVQDKYHGIDNPQKIEIEKKQKNDSDIVDLKNLRNQLLGLKAIIGKTNPPKSENKRKIGILTDIHGLDVPLKVALEDMRSKGITEIYSLGDNLEDGPNPKEVMRLLEEYNVISIAGNAEEYLTLGTEPFHYLSSDRVKNIAWTEQQLSEEEKEKISNYPHSIELSFGGKRVGLCHFATDVRTEFRGVWDYQYNIKRGNAYLQFSKTNSGNESQGKNRAYDSREKDPLFNGKKVDLYDLIIQGHTHFKITEKSPNTEFYTLRANGMGYENASNNTSSYIILEETEAGYKIEEVLVLFDRIKLAESVVSSGLPDKSKIIKFTGLTEEELRIAAENLGLGESNGRK